MRLTCFVYLLLFVGSSIFSMNTKWYEAGLFELRDNNPEKTILVTFLEKGIALIQQYRNENVEKKNQDNEVYQVREGISYAAQRKTFLLLEIIPVQINLNQLQG